MPHTNNNADKSKKLRRCDGELRIPVRDIIFSKIVWVISALPTNAK